MATALHIAHAHELPKPPRRKRKSGSGDGQGFYDYAKRIYADDRADSRARELLLAVAFAVITFPADDGKAQWAQVRDCLGSSRGGDRRLERLLEADLPRYTPPWFADRDPRRCHGPRIRPYQTRLPADTTPADRAAWAKRDATDFRNVQNICGDAGQIHVLEKQLGTGWLIPHHFCNRHAAEADRIREQVREQNKIAPAPIPNSGGLLPSYFDADWMRVYRQYAGPRWEPPVYGIRADDWPVPGREPVAPKARLRLAAVDGDLIGGAR